MQAHGVSVSRRIHERWGWERPHFYYTFHNNFLPVLEGIGVEKVQIEMRQVPFHN